METPQALYKQTATHFTLQFFIRSETEVEGRFMLELADTFLSDFLLPGCRPLSLDTKLPGEGRKLNLEEFSESRWTAAVERILAGECAVVGITAQTADFPNERIFLTVHVNPPGGSEILISGDISISCSVSYLRRLAASSQNVESLLQFGKKVWNGIEGGPAYGFGNLATILARPPLQPWAPKAPDARLPWELISPPAERAHAVPVAYVGSDIDRNLAQLYCTGLGMKGAFWANYLAPVHVAMAGGEQHIRAKLSGIRVESLDHGGLFIVATDSPLPEDTEENGQRFLRIHAVLQPAFLSREATTEMKRPMLSYFFRERPSVIP